MLQEVCNDSVSSRYVDRANYGVCGDKNLSGKDW